VATFRNGEEINEGKDHKNQIKYFDVLVVYSDDVLFGRNITGGLPLEVLQLITDSQHWLPTTRVERFIF
jgi:hypothetical protein